MPIRVMGSGIGRMQNGLRPILLLAILCDPTAVRADDDGATSSVFSLHGFGTLGTVDSDAHAADFVGTPFQPNGAGYSQTWAPGVDSKVGLQLGAQFTDR